MARIKCPQCHDANEYGDYEGPTCDRCLGEGFVSAPEAGAPDYDLDEGHDAGEWNNVPTTAESK
jgi:hypothetical protein